MAGVVVGLSDWATRTPRLRSIEKNCDEGWKKGGETQHVGLTNEFSQNQRPAGNGKGN